MRKLHALAIVVGLAIVAAVVGSLVVFSDHIAVLNPKGAIAAQQRDLLVLATVLSMVVIVPVFTLTFFIAWKYRVGNHKADYQPNWDSNKKLEFAWWGIPAAIILVLSVITWFTSHSLDPYKPLASDVKPLRVQVVALPWKWLFIYPEQGIASVGELRIPEDTPINFEITADAPMNSFWIPRLGGQVYAMAGMTTKLHLMATEPGDYQGSSANLSGEGHAGMTFVAKAVHPSDFAAWASATQQNGGRLGLDEYRELAKPSQNHPVTLYGKTDHELFDTVIAKYMGHH